MISRVSLPDPACLQQARILLNGLIDAVHVRSSIDCFIRLLQRSDTQMAAGGGLPRGDGQGLKPLSVDVVSAVLYQRYVIDAFDNTQFIHKAHAVGLHPDFNGHFRIIFSHGF